MYRTLASALALAAALPAFAQDKPAAPQKMSPEEAKMMEAYEKAGTPGPQHAALAKQVGTYDLSIKSWMAPNAPPTVDTGTATRTMALDGRVLTEEVQARMHGQPFTGHGMQGYDNVTGRYWSTWNDSMSTGLAVADGTCDPQGACTFTSSWNDPVTKAKVTSRMTTKWTSPNVELFEMFATGPYGKEAKMMEMTYTKR